LTNSEAASEPVPDAVASQIAWTFGKDVVLITTLSHRHGVSHTVGYGKTADDQRIADALAAVLSARTESCEQEARKAA
jgi:hypothetical protein